MYLYDGSSPVNWYYDGLMTKDEMIEDNRYSGLFYFPSVILDDGNGKAFGWRFLNSMLAERGLSDLGSPEANFESLLDPNSRTMEETIEEQSNRAVSIMLTKISPQLTDKQVFSMDKLFEHYSVGRGYVKGEIFIYGEDLYRVGQDHTSQEQWVPGADGTTALYSKIEITEGGYEVWQEWDGVSGSYANGQIVQDPTDEQLYKSLIDNNVWGPPSKQPNYWDLYEA